jgi:hypothetical protein
MTLILMIKYDDYEDDDGEIDFVFFGECEPNYVFFSGEDEEVVIVVLTA